MVASQGRRREPALAKAGRYRSNSGVGVGPGISKMRYYLLDWKMLDAFGRGLRKHSSPSLIGLEVPFGGCALRWPVEPCLCRYDNPFGRIVQAPLEHFQGALFSSSR